MNITIDTTATSGNLMLYIKNRTGAVLLQLHNGTSGSCVLVPGSTYFFEWHVWSATSATYGINARVTPPSAGFAPFTWNRTYPTGHDDVGGFYFTV